MADKVGPFDSAPWSQAQWYAFAPQWSPSGIVGGGQTAVTAGPFGVTASALSLTINAANQASKAWVRGAGWQPEATTKTKTVAANVHGSQFRRDRLVIRRDLAAQTVALEIIQGAPAASPVAPTLTQSDTGIWEIPVCSFLVPPASGTTLSGFVDERPWTETWDGADKATQAMISLNASHGLGTAGTLYQLLNADWDSVVDHGRGLLSLVGGAIRCNAPGLVRVEALAISDASDAGWSWLSVGLPFGGGSHLGGLDDRRARATGYAGAGALRQPISDGPIAVQSGDLITYSLAQQNTAAAAVTYQCYLTVTYV